MTASLAILFGALLTAVTATALGGLLLRTLALTLYRFEERLLAFVTGAACLSALVFILCALDLAYPSAFLGLAALIVGAAIGVQAHRPSPLPLPAAPTVWKWILVALFAPFAVLYFFNAMAPEHSADGTAYHLALVAEYFRSHGFVRNVTNVLWNLPQGLELLFLFAYAFGGHSAAALVHFTFLAALPWLMFCYARRFGMTAAGVAAGVFVFASPVVGLDGSIAYVDVALATVLFALFYFLQVWIGSRDNRLLVPVGILAGFSFAIKLTAIAALPYALGLVAWTLWRARKPALRPALTITGIALLFILPWALKDWLWIGNPVVPFATRLFPTPYLHASFEDELRRNMSFYGLQSYSQLPYELTISGHLLQGLLGPVFLLAPLSLLALRTSQGRQLLLAVVVFGGTYFSNLGTRFLIPVLPFLALAMGVSLLRFPALLAMLALAHALASWPDLVDRYCSPSAWRLAQIIPFTAALRIESEDSYLRRTFSGYSVDRMLEEHVPPDATVFAINNPAAAYTSRRILVKFLSGPNENLGDIILTPLYRHLQPSRIIGFRFPERTARGIRILQTQQTRFSSWSISELRIYDSGNELARAPSWRLAAQPNPWDVQNAFDNDSVTRWRSWQAAIPGMHVDVDFGSPRKLDAVILETSPDCADTRVRLQTMDSAGQWSFVAAQPIEEQREISMSLRAAALAEFKRRGVRYLLTDAGDLGEKDFRRNSWAWGIRLVAETGSARLYHIE